MQHNSHLYIDFSIQIGFLFVGALGVLCFYFILNYFKTRRSIYLYYCLFLFFNLLGSLINLRYANWLTSTLNYSDYIAGSGLEFVSLLAFTFYCLFTNRLLDIKEQNKSLYKWILYLGWFTALYGIIYWALKPLIIGKLQLFFFLSRMVILIWSAVTIIGVFRKIKSPVKIYFLLGTGWYFLGTLFAVIRDTTSDLLFETFYSYNSTIYFQAGILLEVICFALALIYKIYIYYEDQQKFYIKTNTRVIYEKEKARAETLAMRVQVNPHFLFNYLNVLKYHIQINENDIAIKYLIKFSKFIRKIIEVNELLIVSLAEELDIINQYLDLERIRHSQKFEFEINVQENINLNQVKIPPLFLQPFLEAFIKNIGNNNTPQNYAMTINILKKASTITIHLKKAGVKSSQKNNQPIKYDFKDDITAERISLFNKNNDAQISYYKLKINNKSINKTSTEFEHIIKLENI